MTFDRTLSACPRALGATAARALQNVKSAAAVFVATFHRGAAPATG
jgi:hypothetical protein